MHAKFSLFAFRQAAKSSSLLRTDDVKAPEDESSGADNDDEETRIQKYKQLLGGLEDAENKNKRRDIEMEITWEPGRHHDDIIAIVFFL